ncbi:MAG: hypothetical protein J7498_01660 [Sphingobium sp.]|nr:hypothetical protein [Sphingobium sp.]
MLTEESTESQLDITEAEPRLPLRAADYLWRPWFAKLWWVAIPIYWMPAGGPTRIAALADFYASGYAAIFNIVFLPVTAMLVLGFGYLRRLFDENPPAELRYGRDYSVLRRYGLPHPTMDEFDPRSGPRWIGNRARDRLIP